ncbi:MAG: helix-turn-helix domain-containing protein, partial [Anaerolineae bacterium]|nr:helix-turn-helix domain-containing protein [Anaerolineae bacterium]
FVTQSQEHHHARVRRVAQAVTASLDMDIRRGEDLGVEKSAIERRLQAVKMLADTSRKHDNSGRYFTFNAAALSQLKNPSDAGIAEPLDQHQNSKAEPKTHYSSGCSSDYKKTTTTTTTQNTDIEENAFPESSQTIPLPTEQTLIYPPRLSENQKLLADRYLAMIAPEDRQLVLD